MVEALRQAIEEATGASTRTASYFHWRVGMLAGQDGVVVPSRATFYRLFERMSHGRHTNGSARMRRSLVDRSSAAPARRACSGIA
ncbi:hypothetical protein ABZ470_21395 [Streptosporangium sp. NPDC020072]|uniref:hypothetical protein n=1 Tax=Streptosporangium sp. NPDC020072 TaxID=3154788 RepID=UPI0034227C5D